MFIKAINRGREIVVVSSDEDNECMSSIFWKENGTIYCFCRSVGILPRPDMTDEKLSEHIEKMFINGAKIFIRGFEKEGRKTA